MQQSNVIFAYLLIAFLLYITLKGELGDYINLLRGGPGGAKPGEASASNDNLKNSAQGLINNVGNLNDASKAILDIFG